MTIPVLLQALPGRLITSQSSRFFVRYLVDFSQVAKWFKISICLVHLSMESAGITKSSSARVISEVPLPALAHETAQTNFQKCHFLLIFARMDFSGDVAVRKH